MTLTTHQAWTLITVNCPDVSLTDVGDHCRCQDGDHGCIRDERGQCRRRLEVLATSETLRNTERQRRNNRRNTRRRLRRLLRRWVRKEVERDHSHKI